MPKNATLCHALNLEGRIRIDPDTSLRYQRTSVFIFKTG